jgi:hypothetical protein
MKVKKCLLIIGILLVCILAGAFTASAVSGAAFTTYNPWVDGAFKDVCKNTRIDCNIYGLKPDVWLNGGPTANGLGSDGDYFFAVLVPGGQPNPNDGGAKNLSDDYDAYTNRTFTVQAGEVYSYTGTHDLDSGDFLDPNRKYCTSKRGCAPDGEPPLIRLYPYADTWNPGGVYILAICSLADGYPVVPRACKYDAFKVKEEQLTISLFLSGMKFEDIYADGIKDAADPGLSGWEVHIYGTDFLGEAVDVTVTTGMGGYWEYQQEFTYNKNTSLVDALLTVCEQPQDSWYQSYPADDDCYDLTIAPASLAEVPDLDFGNFQPVSINAYKFFDRDLDGELDEGEGMVEGFEFCLYDALDNLVSADDFVSTAQDACQLTDADGLVSWTDLIPGTYTVAEGDNPAYWHPTTETSFTLTLGSEESEAVYIGNVVNCVGLTPGYWVNWRNHYTQEEFESLLDGTIAGSVEEADDILTSLGCDDGDAFHCLQRFILANQLTLNLTSSDLLFKPGELYPICELFDRPYITGSIAYWLENALDLTEDSDRDLILWYKTVLDYFANQSYMFL